MLTIREARQRAAMYQMDLRRVGGTLDPDCWRICPLEDGSDTRRATEHESIEDAVLAMGRMRGTRR